MGDDLGHVRHIANTHLSQVVYKKWEREDKVYRLKLIALITILLALWVATAIPTEAEANFQIDEKGITLNCAHGVVRVDAAMPQVSDEFPAQCESADGVVLINLVWFCGIENSGQVQAWTDGEYTGYFTIYLNVLDCSMGRPTTWVQKYCTSPTGTATINLPIYNEEVEEMHVWCE